LGGPNDISATAAATTEFYEALHLFTCFLQRTSQLSRQPTVTAVSEEVICVPGALRIERLTNTSTNTSRVRTLITTWQYLLHMRSALMRKRVPKAIRLRR
jgi:hypothetical protein